MAQRNVTFLRVCDQNGHAYTAIFKMDNQQGPTLWHMELCSVLCGSLNGRGVWGRRDGEVPWLFT